MSKAKQAKTPAVAGTLRLETVRLTLREWEKQDIPDLIEGLNNIEVSKWLAFVPSPYTQLMAEQWIQHCTSIASQSDERRDYEFATALRISP